MSLRSGPRPGFIQERKRVTRPQFEDFWAARGSRLVVMEACSTSYFRARWLRARGFYVDLMPPLYVSAYRRRNKTDRADCEAILEAHRCAGIHPVAIKSEDQQALIALHRVRSQWLESRHGPDQHNARPVAGVRHRRGARIRHAA